jgi:PKD repeat protein
MVSLSNNILTVKGNATGLTDSLYWFWGDGTKTKYVAQNTNVSHTYTTGGNYSVCLKSYNNCGTKDGCLSVTGVGIEEQELKYLNAYPNPVNNTLTIENPYNCSMQLNLYSITGKLLCSNNYENYTSNLDMSNYERGIYFAEILLPDGRKAVRKIVKN